MVVYERSSGFANPWNSFGLTATKLFNRREMAMFLEFHYDSLATQPYFSRYRNTLVPGSCQPRHTYHQRTLLVLFTKGHRDLLTLDTMCKKLTNSPLLESIRRLISMCLRSYHVESTTSRPTCQVKQRWAWLVLGSETAWESQRHEFSVATVFYRKIINETSN
ncbi:unnamed protein product [Thelazia callipaeda]|uniref:Uncharacterized protein n=1 Tax=Thelazia callipaeda TaxID=103827 RepID=A0A0N5CTF6_THECL|nr:unnamed protein product [Thelazia callipaeda]